MYLRKENDRGFEFTIYGENETTMIELYSEELAVTIRSKNENSIKDSRTAEQRFQITGINSYPFSHLYDEIKKVAKDIDAKLKSSYFSTNNLVKVERRMIYHGIPIINSYFARLDDFNELPESKLLFSHISHLISLNYAYMLELNRALSSQSKKSA